MNSLNELDIIAQRWSSVKDNIGRFAVEFSYKNIIKPCIHNASSILELGCADGVMTRLLINDFKDVTVIDGSSIALERLKENIKDWNGLSICSYFENVESLPKKYDAIIMAHILEHVKDPVLVLEKYKGFLSENGKIIITVPNAMSFHRLAGVKMGLLNSIYELNDTDRNVGHLRVYDFDKLAADIEKSGLKILQRDGHWLKFLSNKQIEQYMDYKAIEAYFEMGRQFMENAAEIVVVCGK